MRLALGWAGLGETGLTARAVDGQRLGGTLREARFGDLALGDLDARLSPLPLLVGRARGRSLDGDGGRAPLHGAVDGQRGTASAIDDVTASLPTGRLFAPLPVTALDLDDVTRPLSRRRVRRGRGRVRATLAGERRASRCRRR